MMEAISDSANKTEELIIAINTLLYNYGVLLSATDKQRSTNLHAAASNGLNRVGAWLLESGYPVNSVNKSGETAAHFASRAGKDSFLVVMSQVID
jgi:ankyrin repeat protein